MNDKLKKVKGDVKSNGDELAELADKWLVPVKDLVSQPPREKQYDKKNLDYGRLRAIVAQHADKLEDNEGIMELLPDLNIVKETLVANILSPVDLQEVKLNIGIHKEAPAEIAEIVREHFSTTFDLSSKMGEILGDALMVKGSYVLMPIPPSVISKVIQENTVGLESIDSIFSYDYITKNSLPTIGLVGDTNTNHSYSLESFSIKLQDLKEAETELKDLHEDITKRLTDKDDTVEISDNLMYLLYPTIRDSIAQQKIQQTLSASWGIESLSDIKKKSKKSDDDTDKDNKDKDKSNDSTSTDRSGKVTRIGFTESAEFESTNYKHRQVKDIPFLEMDIDLDDISEFDPVVLNIPPEAVIPVYKPGNPKDHIGYYIFIDEEGNPLKYKVAVNNFREMNNKLDKLMSQQANSNTITLGVSYPGNNGRGTASTSENKTLMMAYANQFEKQLVKAIEDGVSGQKVEIADADELYRIMFARQLEKQKTKVIYVPASMISYIAFNYDGNGRGESLLDKTKLYASFRAILMFATVIAGVKSSINLSTLDITLDNDDPDPQGTVESIINEFVAMQATGLPLGRLNPLDIVDALQKAGMQISINGDRFPGTKMQLAETKRQITPPDSGIMDMLKDIHYAGLWVNRETIEKSNDIEFMGQLTNANNLQNKRFLHAQNTYTYCLADFIKKYICLKGPLFTKLESEYNKLKGKSSLSLKEVIDSIYIILPKSDNVVIKSQMEEYKQFSDFIEVAVNDYIDESMLKDLLKGENINVGIEDVKAAARAMLKRQFMRSKNMLPELDALVNDADDTVGDLLNQHNDLVIKLVANIAKHVTKVEHKVDADIQKLNDKLNPPETTSEEGTGEEVGSEGDGTDNPLDASNPLIDESQSVEGEGENVDENKPDELLDHSPVDNVTLHEDETDSSIETGESNASETPKGEEEPATDEVSKTAEEEGADNNDIENSEETDKDTKKNSSTETDTENDEKSNKVEGEEGDQTNEDKTNKETSNEEEDSDEFEMDGDKIKIDEDGNPIKKKKKKEGKSKVFIK